ncbi:MAG: ribokinase, partial [Dermatophilaceae bacterium]|nr:ribokinase [Dermatophilaceae bacterium]
MSARPVVVVGDVGLDVITRPSGEIKWHSDTPSAVALVPGGAGGNSASWLAGLGASVTLLARVGSDAAGSTCRRELEAAGVTCAFAVDPTLPTCMVVILLDAHGDRTMFPDRGANKAFSVGDVDLVALGLGTGGARPLLHLSGYVLFDAGSRAAGLESLRQARELGWTTSVDPQSHALIEREGASTFLSWVTGVDLLLPNEDEVSALGGLPSVLEHTREVAATYGAAGARWVGADVDVSADAPVVENVDATGCGDAFNAGLLSAWLRGEGRP